MSAMFFFWHAASTADQLARDAAPYHALGDSLARGKGTVPATQRADAQRLHDLVAAYLHYQSGDLSHHHSAAQCVAACTAYWQGHSGLPCHWRKIRNRVMRFELGLPRSLRSAHVRALGDELRGYLQR